MSLLAHGKRLYLDESGEDKSDWIEVRQLSLEEVGAFRKRLAEVETIGDEDKLEAQGLEMARIVCGSCIIAWSEDAELTPENIARLPFRLALRATEAAGLGEGQEEVPLPSGSTSNDSSAETTLQENQKSM